MPHPDGRTTPVIGPLLSIQQNDLQLDNRELPVQTAPFASATDFISHQYDLLYHKYRLPADKLNEEDARSEVFALEDLKRRLSSCVNEDWDRGPFVLSHGDLRLSNILVEEMDDELQIRGIIDWEWASTVPRQFFLPPTWLGGWPPDWVSSGFYTAEYVLFRAALEAGTSEACRQLADEWDRKLPFRMDLPFAVALRHHSCFVSTYRNRVFPMCCTDPWKDVVSQFFEQDGEGGQFSLDVQRRVRDSESFTHYMEANGLRPCQRSEERQELVEPPKSSIQALATYGIPTEGAMDSPGSPSPVGAPRESSAQHYQDPCPVSQAPLPIQQAPLPLALVFY